MLDSFGQNLLRRRHGQHAHRPTREFIQITVQSGGRLNEEIGKMRDEKVNKIKAAVAEVATTVRPVRRRKVALRTGVVSSVPSFRLDLHVRKLLIKVLAGLHIKIVPVALRANLPREIFFRILFVVHRPLSANHD